MVTIVLYIFVDSLNGGIVLSLNSKSLCFDSTYVPGAVSRAFYVYINSSNPFFFLGDKYCYMHFTQKETQAQRSCLCPRTQSSYTAEPEFKPATGLEPTLSTAPALQSARILYSLKNKKTLSTFHQSQSHFNLN